MSYIFFDLEWNQGYPRSEADKLDEIIQIGAWRLDSWEDWGAAFSAYVRPTIHKRLHHRVRKILPLDQNELKNAAPFRKVVRDFFRWCGEDPVFFTWGGCDARVLDMNLCWYGLEEYLDLEIYDLQRAYDLMVAHTDQQTALKDAVATLGLEAQLEYHDAGNDAFYTARIGAEMIRRFHTLPTEEELCAGEEAFRQEKRRQAALLAQTSLEAALPELEPVVQRDCGRFRTPEDCLKSRSARVYRCPECEECLCSGTWYQVGNRYVARSRCVEHGRYYSCLTVEQTPEGPYTGVLSVYGQSFGQELFHLCKVGGVATVMTKTPHKRRRRRKQKPAKQT
ncbi:MAG: exonuclease domain-containing protein [Clostridiales bacterium]|nr:exonuclease domain-containing protein [Clostridiales bacterium]